MNIIHNKKAKLNLNSYVAEFPTSKWIPTWLHYFRTARFKIENYSFYLLLISLVFIDRMQASTKVISRSIKYFT